MIVFVTAMLLLNITPGPDMLYVIARSVGQGRAAGIASALGVGLGCFFHIFAVAFGVAELLRTVPVAYQAIRYAGAAYLIYLGVRMLLAKGIREDAPVVQPARLDRIFLQGAVTNILNPKVALFFLPFLPRFIAFHSSAPQGSAFRQTVTLGLLFDASGTCVNIAVALAASRAGALLPARMKYVTGGVFVVLGLRLAIPERA
jgi:threonine/homoserine/homoserine lactone efflux protein